MKPPHFSTQPNGQLRLNHLGITIREGALCDIARFLYDLERTLSANPDAMPLVPEFRESWAIRGFLAVTANYLLSLAHFRDVMGEGPATELDPHFRALLLVAGRSGLGLEKAKTRSADTGGD